MKLTESMGWSYTFEGHNVITVLKDGILYLTCGFEYCYSDPVDRRKRMICWVLDVIKQIVTMRKDLIKEEEKEVFDVMHELLVKINDIYKTNEL